MTEETKEVKETQEQKAGSEAFQPSESVQLQMTIHELQQANHALQQQLADLRNQVLVRSELIARVAPDWAYDPKARMFTRVPKQDPSQAEEKAEEVEEVVKINRKRSPKNKK